MYVCVHCQHAGIGFTHFQFVAHCFLLLWTYWWFFGFGFFTRFTWTTVQIQLLQYCCFMIVTASSNSNPGTTGIIQNIVSDNSTKLQRGQSQALCYRIFMNVLLWIAITSLGSCGVLHGMNLAVGVWRGRQFRDDLVFRCLIANVYHACIWVAMFKLKNSTAMVSFIWFFSVALGAGVFCHYYNTYNVQMTLSICLNCVLSLFGIGFSDRSFQKWYQKWYQKCCQKCYKRRYGQGQVYHGPPMNTNEGQGTNVLEVEMVVAEA